MILDSVVNRARYEGLHPLFAKAFRHFCDLSQQPNLPPGRCDLGEGDRVYAVIVNAVGRPPAEASVETHRAYIDIQFTVEGCDRIGWLSAASLADGSGYDAAKDIEFFSSTPTTWVDVPAGHFAIFYPEDGHAPLANPGRMIRKIVLKVAV